MEKPLAIKLNDAEIPEVYRVSIDPTLAEPFQTAQMGPTPAIVITRKAVILPQISAGMIDSSEIVSFINGKLSDAILIILPENEGSVTKQEASKVTGDAKFLAEVKRIAPGLAALASQTVTAIRAAGVAGELVESAKGDKSGNVRWINRPLNTFTLKAQPRKSNLQFTLYGNPETYKIQGFLWKDQNSYSRGWVHGPGDVAMLAELARQSHARRQRSDRAAGKKGSAEGKLESHR